MKRFLKIVGILAAFAGVLFYFAFRVLFFDPFEGSFGALTQLAPRDVTFLLRRSDPGHDFQPFPHLDAFAALSSRREWKDFTETRRYEEWRKALDLGPKIEEIDASLAEAGGAIDVDRDVLGKEVLVLGRRRADGTTALAAAFRASFRVKFYAEAVRHSFLRGLAAGVVDDCVDAGDGIATLTVQGQPIHLLRLLDLVVVSDDLPLLRDMVKQSRGEGVGLDDSQYFASAMAHQSDDGRPLDLAVQVGELARAFGYAELSADPEAPVAWKVISQCFHPGDFGMAAGRAFLGGDLDLQLHLGGDMPAIAGSAGGLLSGASGELSALYDLCGRSFPKDVFACGAARLDVDSFVKRLESNLVGDDRKALESFLNDVRERAKFQGKSFDVGSVSDLLARLVRNFGNEMVFALAPQAAYQIKGEKELRVPQSSWGPRVALCFPLSNPTAVRDLVDLFVDSVNGNGARVFRSSYAGFEKYTFREIEFDGVVAPSIAVGFLDLEGREHLVVTTTGDFLDKMCRERINRVQGVSSGLGETLHYQQARPLAEGYGQGFLYLESEGLLNSWKQYAPFLAELENLPDPVALRGQLERKVRDARFPEHRGKPVTKEEQRDVAAEVDDAFDVAMAEWRNQDLPRHIEDIEREMNVVGLFRFVGLTYRVSERDLFVRTFVNSPVQFR